uniref:Putative extracellular matrix protein fras1 n=2 Tax=Anopheles marajoara TaxID=58244 RepID=A0A2M4BP36_9DIPT
MASKSDVRKLGASWPFCRLVVPVVLVLVLMLLPTSCIAREEPVTDVDHLCQHVQCSIDCPDDSYLPSKEEYLAMAESDGTGLRQRRAIAMNNHPQESIKIVPSATLFFPHNQLQPARPQRHFWKRSLPRGSIDLHEMCCPKCVCRECPVTRCPPNFVPASGSAENANRGPGNCCPDVYCVKELPQPQPLKRCYSESFPGRSYTEGEEWNENACTQCKCENGVSRCESPACRPLSCPKKREIAGQCCPVCDEEGSIFCHGHVNCPVSCRHGYLREGSCYLCQCAPPAVNGTILPPLPSPSPTAPSTELDHHPVTEKKMEDDGNEIIDEKGKQDIGSSFAPQPTPVEPTSRTSTYLYLFLLAACVCGALISVTVYCIRNRRSCRGKYSTVPVSTSTITPTTTTTMASTTTPTLIAPVKQVNSSAA